MRCNVSSRHAASLRPSSAHIARRTIPDELAERAGPGRRKLPGMPAPLRRPVFRRVWAGMSLSYGGDRLQQLAQGWLVATLTGSAVGVGLITALGSLPLLLMPLGG